MLPLTCITALPLSTTMPAEQLSPDGRYLAILQPSAQSGVNSVFVTPLPPSSGSSSSSSGSSSSSLESSLLAKGLLAPQQVTDTASPVGDFYWSKDGSSILFVVDSGGGSENYHLYWVPLTFSSSSSSSDAGSAGGAGQTGPDSAKGLKVTPGRAVNLTPFKGVRNCQQHNSDCWF
jgi:hypothetical protein